MKLTAAQEWALKGVADGRAQSPAIFGSYMMDRPGAGQPGKKYKAQALGRIGGMMMERLSRLKLVHLTHINPYGFSCTSAEITEAGRKALADRS